MDSNDAALIDPALSAHSSQTLPAIPPRRITDDDDDVDDGDENDYDDDPIVATYQVLMKPTKHAQQSLQILEAPNKLDPKKDRAPLELRTKPATGMFEIDFPLDHSAAYDRNKGLSWGTALQKSTEAKKGGSHGLAGGFGVGAPPARAPRGARGADALDYDMEWNEALRRDMVLRTQTLGGQTPDAGAESGYMVAVFAGGMCVPGVCLASLFLLITTVLFFLFFFLFFFSTSTNSHCFSSPPSPLHQATFT